MKLFEDSVIMKFRSYIPILLTSSPGNISKIVLFFESRLKVVFQPEGSPVISPEILASEQVEETTKRSL